MQAAASPPPNVSTPVPDLRGLTPLDNLVRFMVDPDAFMRRCTAAGDMVKVRMSGASVVLLRHPELIEQVLVGKNRSFVKDQLTHGLADVIGNGILVSEGEFWRRQRRLVQPGFTRERIARHADNIVAAGERAIAGWQDGATLDVHAAMMDLARDVVATTLLSTEVGREAEEIGAALEVLMARYSDWRYSLAPGLARVPWLPDNRRFAAARARMFAVADGIIAERRRSGTDRGDLLSMLLAARDEDGAAMTDAQLRDEVLVLFLAGHETTALALSWALVLLGRRPGAWARLGAELDAALGDRPATAADLGRLPYTEAVILETMRLYPPAWSIGREAIEEVEIGGVTLARGTQIWLFQWSSHRDERYFARPLAFEPERWLDGLLHRLPRFAYFPFGGGPRLCIGNNFAMLEAVLLLATIARRWRPQVAASDVPRPQFSITLRPRDGVRATLRRRPQAQ
jgi:cytochrome P450